MRSFFHYLGPSFPIKRFLIVQCANKSPICASFLLYESWIVKQEMSVSLKFTTHALGTGNNGLDEKVFT